MSGPLGEYHTHISGVTDATNIAGELEKLSGELLDAAAALEEATNLSSTLQTDIDTESSLGRTVITSLGEARQTMNGTEIISPMNSSVIDGLGRFGQAETALQLGGISLSSAKDEVTRHTSSVTTVVSEFRSAAGEMQALIKLLGAVGSQSTQAQGMTKQ